MNVITLDGPDGSGKSTLSRELESNIPDAYRIHFPRQHRDISLMTEEEALLFFLSDFEQGLQSVSSEVKTLIMDRSFISTMAYQGFSEDGYAKKEWALESAKQIGLRQITGRAGDITFVYLHCSPETSVRRLKEEPSGEADEVSNLDTDSQRDRLTTLGRCYRRAYAYLEHDCPDPTYVTLNSEEKSPQELIKDFRQQSS